MCGFLVKLKYECIYAMFAVIYSPVMSNSNHCEKDIHKISQGLTKPLALVGMMGAGKSHIGAMLAVSLSLPFVDIDGVIEEKAGMAIPEIFENFGEAKFRDVEAKTIRDCIEDGVGVLSTGGGALMREETLGVLKERSVMVWLRADVDLLWDRVRDSSRPLLQVDDPKAVLADLMHARAPLYRQAHIHIDVTNNARETMDMIFKALLTRLNLDKE